MPSSGLWKRAKPRMAKRSGHAESGGLEGRSERPARGHGQPLTGPLPTPFAACNAYYSTSAHEAFTTASILSSERPPFAKAWLAFTLPSL